jgi:2-polyprenyl-3-methyl-5-hydroxy-6-metoxy-1,4-benzoquinol methylase
MLNKLKNRIYLKLHEYKSKYNWKKWEHYDYATMFPDRHRNQIAAAEKYFIPVVDKESIIADIGCGDGWFTFIIAPHVKRIDAIDLSKPLLKIAKKKQLENGLRNIEFVNKDVEKALNKMPYYTSIMCMGLFTCITSDDKVKQIIRAIHKKISEGGYLFLKDSLTFKEDIFFESGSYAAKYRNDDAYKKMFINNGFELISEGLLSDVVNQETGGFSGFKLFKKR